METARRLRLAQKAPERKEDGGHPAVREEDR